MRRRIFLSVFVLMLFAAGSCAPAQAQEGYSGDKRIIDIRVKGNKAVSTSTILNKLKLKAGDLFEESALNKELKRLYATGYFGDVFVETEERPEGIIVIFAVTEKPTVEKIEFQGNVRIKKGRLAKKISVKEGDLLDFHLLSQDVGELRTYYVEEGYSRIEIDYRIDIDPQTGGATVVFLIDEGYPLRIKTIEVEGNENIPDNEIKKYMATKTAWWFIQKGAFDEEKFQADLDRIRAVYRSKGFLDARLTSRMDYAPDGEDLYLTIVVDEGKEYLVGDIKVEGELAFPEKEVRGEIKISSGDPFDYEKIKEDMDSIRAFYYDRGYMDAEIDLRHKYNPDTDRMDLIYVLKAHDEISVGKINIIGNTRTKDKVIRRELRVYPGEKYDGKKLKRSKERIYNLGFFEDVYFETVPGDRKDVKDLDITVKETKTGELSFGGGYSSVDAFIGFVQIRQGNFDIMNFPTFTGSGQSLTIRAEVGSARTNYLLSWTDPWIFDYPFLFGFDFYREEHDRYSDSGYGYDERRTGGSLRLGKELTDQLSTGIVYNLEEVKISDIPDNATTALRKEEGKNMISRLTWSLKHDTRDNVYSPTKGWISGVSLENAGGFIGGDKDFVKGYLHASFYYSILENIVLELKGRSGLVESYGDSKEVPIYERFFAGGATTIRGYGQRSVGPRDRGTNTALGGEATVIGNAEVVFPIFKKLIKGAVFCDAGNVMEKSRDLFSGTGYKMGAGVGVRVKTPIGPVKLDYGYPLSDNYDDKKEGQFYFSVSHGF
ncbi:MAG: outer membrane protein assembly factor BamA [Candidatus Makaraimicrobium thalassicum]|nr:MAG: outer membrane protein assembly factor BamA [Candidatus Omnitrophota bacterium]